jgi:hypothetical protein
MNHIVGENWKSGNKSRRIDIIVEALNREGKADVEYFKGRSYLTKVLFGKGNPQPIRDRYQMNQVKIRYQQKDAVLLYYTKISIEGQFFNENFSENEIQNIKNALAEAGIFTWRDYNLKRNKFRKYCYSFLIGIGLINVFVGYQSNDAILILSGIIMTLFFLFIFFYK